MPFSEEKSIDQSLDDTEIRTTVNYWNHILESKCGTREYSTPATPTTTVAPTTTAAPTTSLQ
jgi:hypothetical protein